MNKHFLLPLAAFLAGAAGCSKDAPAAMAGGKRPASAAAAVENESAGEVVIPQTNASYTVARTTAAGSVTGTVALKNPLPPQAAVSTGRDNAACGDSIPDESVQGQGGGLGGVVVWIDGIHIGKTPNSERRLELESLKCKLAPRVQAAMVGSAVNIIGHDELRQHLRFLAAGDSAPRTTILLGGGEQVIPTELPFKTAGMVTVRDAGHPWTRAFLAVFDHPYFSVTAPNGTFTIDGVPAGTYTLHAWHERTGATSQQIVVGASGAVNVKLSL